MWGMNGRGGKWQILAPLCLPPHCVAQKNAQTHHADCEKKGGENPIVVERGRRRRETAAASQHVVGCVLEPHWYRTYTYMY